MIITIILTLLAVAVVVAGALVQNKADVAKMNGQKIFKKK